MESINRREFLDRSKKGLVGLAASMPIVAAATVAHTAQDSPKRRPTVMCVYYPHWHSYDHGSAWKGEGWTEWEGVKAAIPRFPGHHQPLKPTWGYFDESDPKWSAREIDLAADHGIDVFLFDWYWYSGVKNMEEALEQGFLRAANRDRMKFALMWANHDRRDQFCPEFGKERTVWLPSRHSPRDLERVMDYGIEHYFRQPNYWRRGGAPVLQHLPGHTVRRATWRPAGNPQAVGTNGRPATPGRPAADALERHGGRSEIGRDPQGSRFSEYEPVQREYGGESRPDLTEQYEDLVQAHRDHWQKMTAAAPLVNLPVVTTGWDATPRCAKDVPWPFPVAPTSGRHEYPYVPVVVGNTPERFEQLLRDAARHVERDPRQPFAVLINAWNEWTEGCYLLPEERTGTARLEAIQRTFGTADR